MNRMERRVPALLLIIALGLGGCDSDFDTTTPPPPPPDPTNTDPNAADQAFATDEDTPLEEQVVADDPDGDPLIYQVVIGSGPNDGRLESFDEATGEFRYVPDRDFNGDSTFDVTVSDDRGGSATFTVTITVSCPDDQCSWDKFNDPDDPGLSNAREPSIAVDTALRVNVAFVEDNTPNGGTAGDIFVFGTDPMSRSFSKLAGSGTNGALNTVAEAARPDLIASLVPPTALAVAWDEGDNIVVAAREDLNATWTDVSGAPNSVAAEDPVLTLDAVTGSPLVAWTSIGDPLNTDALLAANTGFNVITNPGTWQPLDAPLDTNPANPASRVAIASDDVPGGGTNVFGRSTVAWAEEIGGVSQVIVRQCDDAGAGALANCPQLGTALNVDPTLNASEPAITVPSAATAAVIGGDPSNPRAVVAFVENGNLYVKRFEPGTGDWVQLSDPTTADGRLNVGENGTALNPAIVVDVLGRYTVVWNEVNLAQGNSFIFSKRLDAAGGGVWTPLGGILNCDPISGIASNPDIAVDSAGVPYITFQETDRGGDSHVVVMSFEN